ncbi:hypothetical protein BGX38DRAFT_706215 [Terfezia claveryi]|nr:hypothetical protein BGX38DRAFT_706215 [Terfezia claveryi]
MLLLYDLLFSLHIGPLLHFLLSPFVNVEVLTRVFAILWSSILRSISLQTCGGLLILIHSLLLPLFKGCFFLLESPVLNPGWQPASFFFCGLTPGWGRAL